MALQYSCDAQSNDAGVALPLATPTAVLTTNPIPVPFQTAKARVLAIVNVAGAAGTTGYTVTLRRNPNAENLLIKTYTFNALPASQSMALVIGAIDSIPDGRDVSYQVVVSAAGAAANTLSQFIEAALLSG